MFVFYVSEQLNLREKSQIGMAQETVDLVVNLLALVCVEACTCSQGSVTLVVCGCGCV